MKRAQAILAAVVLSGVVAGDADAQRRREGKFKVGDQAPDFTINDVSGKQSVTLSKLRGKPVVLIFGSCT